MRSRDDPPTPPLRFLVILLGIAHLLGGIIAEIVFSLRFGLRAGNRAENAFWTVAET